MALTAKKATDFTVLLAPANSCAGCWFAGKYENNLPLCWANATNPMVKQVFTKTGGSCTGVIAVLSDEVNILKTA